MLELGNSLIARYGITVCSIFSSSSGRGGLMCINRIGAAAAVDVVVVAVGVK